MIDFKCCYYETAVQAGDEKIVKNMIPHSLPDETKDKYEQSHASDFHSNHD